jgi:anti-sigma factor RsiW
MLLASETRQLAQRHVQRRFRQRAAAAVVAGLLAGRQLPQVSDDALGAQQVSTRELVQRSRRAAVAALLHETHTLVKHLALSSHASVF